MKHTRYIFVTVFFLACIPIVYTYIAAGSTWRGVVPQFVNDDVYYYARMENIVHGYPFIGNPFFYEHRMDTPPAFFVADWIAAVPLLLGVPFIIGICLNFIVWSIVFSFFIYLLLREFELFGWSLYWGTILSYCTVYGLILRPVSMQIVAPFFILFLFAYARWMKTDMPTRTQHTVLVVSFASSFYIYTYSWQLTVIILGVTGLWLLYEKKWQKLKQLIGVVCAGILLASPAVFYMAKQIANPYYWDSIMRIGLTNTRVPTALSFYDSFGVCVVLCLWCIGWKWIRGLHTLELYKNSFVFVMLTGVSFILALFSNVITGKDVEISNHFERFLVVWIVIVIFLYVSFVWQYRRNMITLALSKKVLLAVLMGVSLAWLGYFFIQGFFIGALIHTDVTGVQAYGAPLDWLNMYQTQNGLQEAVVWSDGTIGPYIPINTRDFELFDNDGELQLLSSKELEERYLVSQYFNNLTTADIERDFRAYAGVGNAVHQYKTHNRTVTLCRIFLSHVGVTCGNITDPISLKGVNYFVNLHTEYTQNIRPNILPELKKFHVTYIIKDKIHDVSWAPDKIPGTKLLWSNERFEIYSIDYT